MAKKKEGFSYKPYEKSEEVTRAEEKAAELEKPQSYTSQWQGKIDGLLQQLENRKGFTYDAREDALYQQMKDQYIRQGHMAMEDTLGKAATLTGGYDNSYAQSAGQQVYGEYLQGLSDKLPEYYRMAKDAYDAQGQALSEQLADYRAMEEQDYSRYMDSMAHYFDMLGQYTEDARYAADTDYSRYRDAYEDAYGRYRDEVEDDRYDREQDYERERDEAEDARRDREQDYERERDAVEDKQWQAEFDEDKRRYEAEHAPKPIAVQSALPQKEESLSKAGETFLKNLPYAHAGSEKAWKKLVATRLQNAAAAGSISQSDAAIIRKQLGLE